MCLTSARAWHYYPSSVALFRVGLLSSRVSQTEFPGPRKTTTVTSFSWWGCFSGSKYWLRWTLGNADSDGLLLGNADSDGLWEMQLLYKQRTICTQCSLQQYMYSGIFLGCFSVPCLLSGPFLALQIYIFELLVLFLVQLLEFWYNSWS